MRQISKQFLTKNGLATFVFVAGLSAAISLVWATAPNRAIGQEVAAEDSEIVAEDVEPSEADMSTQSADGDVSPDTEVGVAEDQAIEGTPELDPVIPPKPGWVPFDLVDVPDNLDEVDQSAVGPFLIDPLTGVALGGYDPVSFFVADAPKLGDGTLEFFWGGISWYFSSEANLDAFRRAPEFYTPQFGGYGTMAMARGFLSQGEPLVYEVLDDELFFFFSASNKAAFELIKNSARLDARQNWLELRTKLVPN